MITRSELTDEEWEALQRVNRGQPEAGLVPATLAEFLMRHGLVQSRRGALGLTDAGRRLLLREKRG